MTTSLRRLLVLVAAVLVGGCASYYPYYGHDGVYYGKKYYDSYYGYGYGGYGYYPYYYNPYSSFYYSRSSYYYPYYPYYGYYGWDDDDRGDDDRHDNDRDESASEELNRIIRSPISRGFPRDSGDSRIIRRGRFDHEIGSVRPPRDRISNAQRELQRIDFDALPAPAQPDFNPQPTRPQPGHTPRPQPRRHTPASAPRPQLQGITSELQDRVRR